MQIVGRRTETLIVEAPPRALIQALEDNFVMSLGLPVGSSIYAKQWQSPDHRIFEPLRAATADEIKALAAFQTLRDAFKE
jgi:hypothetical protein